MGQQPDQPARKNAVDGWQNPFHCVIAIFFAGGTGKFLLLRGLGNQAD